MTTRVVRPDRLTRGELDAYLEQGWFRIGQTMMTCRVVLFDGTLRTALWTRLPLQGHEFSRSSRKLLSRNRRRFRVEVRDVVVDDQREALYQRYRRAARGDRSPSLDDFLYGDADPLDLFYTREIDLWQGDRLVAFSWFDVGHQTAQSLMGVYDPELSRHSLGFTTMLLEIEEAARAGVRYYYPGYVLPGEPAMDYKLRIGNVEWHDPDRGVWRPWSRRGLESCGMPRPASVSWKCTAHRPSRRMPSVRTVDIWQSVRQTERSDSGPWNAEKSCSAGGRGVIELKRPSCTPISNSRQTARPWPLPILLRPLCICWK